MQVLPAWALSIPLPAAMMIAVSLYMVVLGVGLWIRYCLKDVCSRERCCCPDVSVWERCLRLAEMCDCRLQGVDYFLPDSCSCPACASMESCSFQPPQCESCNCFCFEIRVK